MTQHKRPNIKTFIFLVVVVVVIWIISNLVSFKNQFKIIISSECQELA